MSSVTGRIGEIKQPRGGYIKPSQFKEIIFDDGYTLGEENIHASIVGMCVDYMTRYIMGAPMKEAFKISAEGYKARVLLAGKAAIENDIKKKVDFNSLVKQMKGFDAQTITAACKICTYDVWYRNPMVALTAKGAEDTNPDAQTVENIQVLIDRSVTFWEKYGPITVDGFTFEGGGYTDVVDSGDGDYLTADTMWDFKVSKSKPTNKHTLQLLMYWIMGQHSGKLEFKNIKKLGFYNPRLNTAYLLDIDSIPSEIIREVETQVICYK